VGFRTILSDIKNKVFRADDPYENGHELVLPFGTEFDEFKEKAFQLVYPGNGEAPLYVIFPFLRGLRRVVD